MSLDQVPPSVTPPTTDAVLWRRAVYRHYGPVRDYAQWMGWPEPPELALGTVMPEGVEFYRGQLDRWRKRINRIIYPPPTETADGAGQPQGRKNPHPPPPKEANDLWDAFSRLLDPLLKVVGELERELEQRGQVNAVLWRRAVHSYYGPLYHLAVLMDWPRPPALAAVTLEGIETWRGEMDCYYKEINRLVYGSVLPPEPPAPAPALHHNEWQILTVLAARPKVAMIQADIGENTDPKLSPQTVARWLKKMRERGLTEPLNSGGECITAKGLSLVHDYYDRQVIAK